MFGLHLIIDWELSKILHQQIAKKGLDFFGVCMCVCVCNKQIYPFIDARNLPHPPVL